MNEETTKVLLIDLENCPSQINQLMNHLDEYSHIVICYAQSGAKIPVDWIMPLTTTINSNRLKLVKMPEVGKNAADFGIAFWAGILMAQLPEKAHFDIISNDTDLDYVVSLLASENRSAERRGNKKEIPLSVAIKSVSSSVVEQPKAITSEIMDYYPSEFCVFLANRDNKHRPSKKETLLNSIKNTFKADNVDVDKVFEILQENGVVSINDNKVSYNQQKINKFAAAI